MGGTNAFARHLAMAPRSALRSMKEFGGSRPQPVTIPLAPLRVQDLSLVASAKPRSVFGLEPDAAGQGFAMKGPFFGKKSVRTAGRARR